MARRVISWEERLADVVEENILKYVEDFSEEKVIPAIKGLMKDFDFEGGEGALEEFDDIVDSMYDKFDSMADIQAGKLWTDSQIQVGAEKGFKEYVSISERDKDVCDFCDEMDGEIIGVEQALKQIGEGEEQKFIDVDDLDEIDDVSESGLRSPYHGKCRCRIALLEEEGKVEKGGPGSGNFGHEGRPGEVGGSAPSEGSGGEKETVYHGTSHDRMVKIVEEGVKSKEYTNWESESFSRNRENSVFVATGSKGFDLAVRFAKAAEESTGKAAVVIEARIPKVLFGDKAERDNLVANVKGQKEAWKLPEVKAEWITNVYDTEGNVATKTIDSLTGIKFKEEKEETVKIFIPLSEEVLKEIDKKASDKK